MRENRDAAVDFLFRWEGDELNTSLSEPGGASKYGVSVPVLTEFNVMRGLPPASVADIAALTRDKAKEVCLDRFGTAIDFDDLPAGVDLMMLNVSFNLGVSGGLGLLAAVLGSWSSTSIADLVPLARAADPKQLIRDLSMGWIAIKSRSPSWAPRNFHGYGHGWTNRHLAAIPAAVALIPTPKMAAAQPAASAEPHDHVDGCDVDFMEHAATPDRDLPKRLAMLAPGPAHSFSLTWLPAVLFDAGLHVALQPGWETRGHREMGPVRGVICHHTAGAKAGNMPSLGVLINGRPDLSGPLSQLGLGRDGTWYVVAAGLCFHAGKGEWKGITTGNTNFIGIEAENTGRPDDPWPKAQLDSYARGVAAILRHVGAPSAMCAGHKEYALPPGRKDDPDFNMPAFRATVDTILAAFSAGVGATATA